MVVFPSKQYTGRPQPLPEVTLPFGKSTKKKEKTPSSSFPSSSTSAHAYSVTTAPKLSDLLLTKEKKQEEPELKLSAKIAVPATTALQEAAVDVSKTVSQVDRLFSVF